MVAPGAGDVEVVPGEADELEAVLLEHALRGDVVDERAGLEAMQAERPERMLGESADRARRQPAPVPLRVDPVAEVGAAEGVVDDVRQPDEARQLAVVQDRELQPVCVAGDLELVAAPVG